MSAISSVLWPGAREIIGSDVVNGGIFADKPGYHNTRDRLRERGMFGDYSIQLPKDLEGPGNLASAIDLTFLSAQRGDYRNIARFSRRLYVAGENKDPRCYPMREFYANIDLDDAVEGWSYYRDDDRTSTPSHKWHIHISVWRKYINDIAAMFSILSIMNGGPMQVTLSDATIEKIANRVAAKVPTAKENATAVWDSDTIPNDDPENRTVQADNAVGQILRDTTALRKGQA